MDSFGAQGIDQPGHGEEEGEGVADLGVPPGSD